MDALKEEAVELINTLRDYAEYERHDAGDETDVSRMLGMAANRIEHDSILIQNYFDLATCMRTVAWYFTQSPTALMVNERKET